MLLLHILLHYDNFPFSPFQFTFASNAATIVGGCLVTNRYKLRMPAAFISAFVISVSYSQCGTFTKEKNESYICTMCIFVKVMHEKTDHMNFL